MEPRMVRELCSMMCEVTNTVYVYSFFIRQDTLLKYLKNLNPMKFKLLCKKPLFSDFIENQKSKNISIKI